MSVIHFDPDELGAVLACLYLPGVGDENLCYLDLFTRYAAANAAAYRATYGDAAPAVSREALVRSRDQALLALNRDRAGQLRRAARTSRLLRYNLIANSGRDAATPDLVEGLLVVAGRLLALLTDPKDNQER